MEPIPRPGIADAAVGGEEDPLHLPSRSLPSWLTGRGAGNATQAQMSAAGLRLVVPRAGLLPR